MTRSSTLPLVLAAALFSSPAAAGQEAESPFPFLNQQATAPAADADPAEALARNLRVLGDNPNDLEALMGAGRAALECGDPSSSIGFWARADKLSPGNGRIKAGLAAALVQAEQPRHALQLFDQAVRLGVPEDQVASDRGLANDLLGDNRRAQADYRLALKAHDDPEVTRRLALSLAMTGDKAAALAALDPLLRKQDMGAWRARAFVLALTGDVNGADADARSVLPAPQAAQIAPFLARLASLPHDQQAAAVHFGDMPVTRRPSTSLELARNDRPASTPPVRAVASPGSAATSQGASWPTLVAAATQRPAGAVDFAGRPLANRTPAAASPPPPSAYAPAGQAGGSSYSPPRQAITPPASVTGYAAATPAPASPLAPSPYASPVRQPPASPTANNVPVPAPRPAAPLPSGPLLAARQTEPSAAAMPHPAAPAIVARTQQAPAPAVPRLPANTLGAQAMAIGVPPVFIAAAAPIVPHVTQPVVPTDATAAPARPVHAEHASTALSPSHAHPAELAAVDIEEPATPRSSPGRRDRARSEDPGSADRTRGGDTGEGASAKGRGSAHARDTAFADADSKASAGRSSHAASRDGDQDSDAKGGHERRGKDAELADADSKSARGKSGRAGKDSVSAKEKTAKADPARIWVQVAGGANKNDLGKAWAKLKKASPDLYAGHTPSSTPLRFTNRLLVGPFKSEDEAQDYVNKLSKGGQSGFMVKTTPGQKVEKVGAD